MAGKRCAVILCGGNIDLDWFREFRPDLNLCAAPLPTYKSASLPETNQEASAVAFSEDIQPDRAAFRDAYDAGRAQVVWTTLVADLETPVSATLKLAEGRPYSFLLESVTGGAVRGRYSMIGTKPDLVWRCRGDAAEINRNARFDLDELHRRRAADAGEPQGRARREPHRSAGRAAAHGRRPLRLHDLRHDPPVRARRAGRPIPTRSASSTRSFCGRRWSPSSTTSRIR